MHTSTPVSSSSALRTILVAVCSTAFLVCPWSSPAAGGPMPGDDQLVWSQQEYQLGSYPSMRVGDFDVELADDFYLVGEVTVVEASGRPQATHPSGGTFEAVEVRFYDVAENGGPGEIQAEYSFAAGDPAILSDVEPAAYAVRVELPTPFVASGWHFIGVQVIDSDGWSRINANSTLEEFVRGSYCWRKDDNGSGVWEPFQPIPSRPRFDLSTRIFGRLGAPATIEELTDETPTRSGLVLVGGLNMGGEVAGGHVLIDGRPALVTEWTDRYIHVYVPESVDLGDSEVRVVTAAGPSDPAPITITERVPDGKVRWTFTADSRYSIHRPAVAPNGDIVFQTVDGRVYALSPDGALLWIRQFAEPGLGDEGPLAIGADGTIYAGFNPLGSETQIHALDPADGSTIWTFTTTGGQGMIAGVGVGPDGSVYAIFDRPGIGAVSLDPTDGSVRWTNPGDPAYTETGQLGIELAFSDDRFFFGFDEFAAHPISQLYAMSYDGEQLWAVGRPDNNAQPRVLPDGSLTVRAWGSSSGQQQARYSEEGELLWTTDQSPAAILSNPGVGPDGTIYVTRANDDLWALDLEGETRWMTAFDEVVGITHPSPDPNGEIVLVGGVQDTEAFYDPGLFAAVDAETGDRLWTIDLPTEADGAVFSASAPARFSPDGRTAYFPLQRNFNNDFFQRSFLYALDATGPGLFADGFESGTTERWE